MADRLDGLARLIRRQLGRRRIGLPTAPVLRTLLETAYLATLRTEEGRFVRGCLTYADPRNPEPDPPITRRADYPSFTSFEHPVPLTVENLVKMSRAVDRWSGSIAVFAQGTKLAAWGVVDQLVHLNVRMNREGEVGVDHPGILTIVMEGTADLTVYHGGVLLGALRQDRLIARQPDALADPAVTKKIAPLLRPLAKRLAVVLGDDARSYKGLEMDLVRAWTGTIARLCIGSRRLGTGGGYVISPKPLLRLLDIKNRLNYERLNSSAILGVQDKLHFYTQRENARKAPTVGGDVVWDAYLAQADSEDRDLELAGAVRLVSSFAAVDGVVLIRAPLNVVGFGAKITASGEIGIVYDGVRFEREGIDAPTVDYTKFGTRHNSILRYCRRDPKAIGIVISQDGQVRLITTSGRSLLLWDDVRLLEYSDDVASYFKMEARGRRYRQRRRHEAHVGYTSLPKTLGELLAVRLQ